MSLNFDLTEGTHFENMKEARLAVKTWLLRNSWSSKVAKSNPQKTSHRCISRECPFTLNITSSKRGVRLTRLVHHTCPVSTHDSWHGKNSVAVLARDPLNIGLFLDNPKAKPAQVQSQELRVHGNNITKHTAWRTRERIRREQLNNGSEKPSVWIREGW